MKQISHTMTTVAKNPKASAASELSWAWNVCLNQDGMSGKATQVSSSVVMFTDTTHVCKCTSRYISTPPEGGVVYIATKAWGVVCTWHFNVLLCKWYAC